MSETNRIEDVRDDDYDTEWVASNWPVPIVENSVCVGWQAEVSRWRGGLLLVGTCPHAHGTRHLAVLCGEAQARDANARRAAR